MQPSLFIALVSAVVGFLSFVVGLVVLDLRGRIERVEKILMERNEKWLTQIPKPPQ